jgi:uncharacterized protein YhaN
LTAGLVGGGGALGLSFIIKDFFIILLAGGIGILSVLLTSSIVLFAVSSKKAKERDALAEGYGCSFSELTSAVSLCISELQKKQKHDGELKRAEEIFSIAKSRKEEKERLLLSALASIGVSPTNDLVEVAEKEYERAWRFLHELSELQSKILVVGSKAEHIKKGLEGYSSEELRATVPAEVLELDAAEIEKALRVRSFNANKLSILERDIIDTTNKIAALKAVDSDPLALSDRIALLEEKYRADDEFCSAIDLAIEEITKAGEAIRAGVAPTIAMRAGEMLESISGGKYSKLYADKQMDITAEDSESGYSYASSMLSGGTKDGAYLCLRISLMMQLFGEDIPPLVLDEALSQLDDTRAEATLKLLGRLAEEGMQCLVFSCHSREEQICKELGLTHNTIRL